MKKPIMLCPDCRLELEKNKEKTKLVCPACSYECPFEGQVFNSFNFLGTFVDKKEAGKI